MAESEILHMLITIGVLLFAAKLVARLVNKMKQSAVLGEIIAGIVIGPFALGGLPLINGEPLVVLDETILHVGEIAAIIILFVAGMQTTPKEFMKLGAPSFTVGALGVIAPFFAGYFILSAVMGVETLPAIIVATALTATSIAISVQVLSELGRLGSREGRLILGAAVADDVLGIAVLSVVLTMVNTGNVSPEIGNITFLLLQILGIYGAILVASVFLVPRLVNSTRLWGPKGSTEVAATASCFVISGVAAFVGLSPIVGAFAAGMAITATKAFHKIREYAEKLDVFFAPLFFAIVGARVDLRGVNLEVMALAGVIIAIAVVTKLAGCGLPSMIFLKDRGKAMKVGIGMISRGEVGLIVAAAGASAGVLSGTLYTTVVIMVAASTIITPVWLKVAYRKEPPEPATTAVEKEETQPHS